MPSGSPRHTAPAFCSKADAAARPFLQEKVMISDGFFIFGLSFATIGRIPRSFTPWRPLSRRMGDCSFPSLNRRGSEIRRGNWIWNLTILEGPWLLVRPLHNTWLADADFRSIICGHTAFVREFAHVVLKNRSVWRSQGITAFDPNKRTRPVVTEVALPKRLVLIRPLVGDITTGSAKPNPAKYIVTIGDDIRDDDGCGVVPRGGVLPVVSSDWIAPSVLTPIACRGPFRTSPKTAVMEGVPWMCSLVHHLVRSHKSVTNKSTRAVIIPLVLDLYPLTASILRSWVWRAIKVCKPSFNCFHVTWSWACPRIGITTKATNLFEGEKTMQTNWSDKECEQYRRRGAVR